MIFREISKGYEQVLNEQSTSSALFYSQTFLIQKVCFGFDSMSGFSIIWERRSNIYVSERNLRRVTKGRGC